MRWGLSLENMQHDQRLTRLSPQLKFPLNHVSGRCLMHRLRLPQPNTGTLSRCRKMNDDFEHDIFYD